MARHNATKPVTLILAALMVLSATDNVEGRPHVRDGKNWRKAHATFYGGADASGTMGNSLQPLVQLRRRPMNPYK